MADPQRTSLPEPEQTGEPNASKKPVEVSYMLELTLDELLGLDKMLRRFFFNRAHPLKAIRAKLANLRKGSES